MSGTPSKSYGEGELHIPLPTGDSVYSEPGPGVSVMTRSPLGRDQSYGYPSYPSSASHTAGAQGRVYDPSSTHVPPAQFIPQLRRVSPIPPTANPVMSPVSDITFQPPPSTTEIEGSLSVVRQDTGAHLAPASMGYANTPEVSAAVADLAEEDPPEWVIQNWLRSPQTPFFEFITAQLTDLTDSRREARYVSLANTAVNLRSLGWVIDLQVPDSATAQPSQAFSLISTNIDGRGMSLALRNNVTGVYGLIPRCRCDPRHLETVEQLTQELLPAAKLKGSERLMREQRKRDIMNLTKRVILSFFPLELSYPALRHTVTSLSPEAALLTVADSSDHGSLFQSRKEPRQRHVPRR